jgi:hypothetical protein
LAIGWGQQLAYDGGVYFPRADGTARKRAGAQAANTAEKLKGVRPDHFAGNSSSPESGRRALQPANGNGYAVAAWQARRRLA